MNRNKNIPTKWDVNPNDYPHNTIINNLIKQARDKAWAQLKQPTHPAYLELQELMSERDGLSRRTRETREEIFEINYPSNKSKTFPK